MTYQQKVMQDVILIGSLLKYIPHCKNEGEENLILEEVRNMRRRITDIEEMTRTEKQLKVKEKIMTIESDLN
jgi:hypothetical protein